MVKLSYNVAELSFGSPRHELYSSTWVAKFCVPLAFLIIFDKKSNEEISFHIHSNVKNCSLNTVSKSKILALISTSHSILVLYWIFRLMSLFPVIACLRPHLYAKLTKMSSKYIESHNCWQTRFNFLSQRFWVLTRVCL